MVCLGTQIHLMQKIQLSVLMALARDEIHCNRLEFTAICLSEQIYSPRLEKASEACCICFWSFSLQKKEETNSEVQVL